MKTRLSFLDYAVIGLLIIVAAALAYRFSSSETNFSTNNSTICYTIKINGVREFTYEYYQLGLDCFDRQTGKYIGTIVGVRKEPYVENVELLDGSSRQFEKPGIIAIYVDIEASGNETGTAYYAEGTYEIKAGSELSFTTKFIEVSARIMDVSAK